MCHLCWRHYRNISKKKKGHKVRYAAELPRETKNWKVLKNIAVVITICILFRFALMILHSFSIKNYGRSKGGHSYSQRKSLSLSLLPCSILLRTEFPATIVYRGWIFPLVSGKLAHFLLKLIKAMLFQLFFLINTCFTSCMHLASDWNF